MKRIKLNFALLLMIIIPFSSCEDECETFETINFEADFFTDLKSFEESDVCTGSKNLLNTQEGSGTATLLGAFTTTITFCVDPNTFEYDNGVGSFVADNGEEIFFEGGGQVLPSDEPGYDLEFQDIFTITGGTGRFEGATGVLITDSYVNNETQRTDHIWSGNITLKK